MEIWNYHFETGELIGSSLADESPLEPGVWLLPAHSTIIAPPTKKNGFALAFDTNASKWIHIEDHRGETWWNEKGESVIISELGPVVGLLSEQPEPEPVPPPPELTIEEKLASVGLSVDDLKTVLGIK